MNYSNNTEKQRILEGSSILDTGAVVGALEGSPGTSREPLGGSWEPLGGFRGRLGSLWGRLGRLLGAPLGRSSVV